jgi:ribosome recycling factor
MSKWNELTEEKRKSIVKRDEIRISNLREFIENIIRDLDKIENGKESELYKIVTDYKKYL